MRVRQPRILIRLLLTAIVAGGLAGCPGAGDKGVLITPVLPAGLGGVARYQVIGVLDDKDSAEGPREVATGKVPFTLVLPAASRGTLRVFLDAADGSSLLVAYGHAEIVIGDETSYELPVHLERAGCGSAFCYDSESSRALSLHAVWGDAPHNVFAVGARGAALHFDGFAWESIDSGTQQDLYGVWGSGEGDVRFVGAGGTIIKHDKGPEASDIPMTLRAIWGAGPADIWVVGDGGTIMRYVDGAWQRDNEGGGASLNAVWGTGKDDVWAAGELGVTAHRSDRGWSLEGGMIMDSLRAVAGTAEGVFVAGDNGTLLQRTGTAWTVRKSNTTSALFALWGGDKLWAAGQGGLVLSGDSGGLQAAPLTSPTLRGLWGDGEGAVWAVGDQGAIARAEDGTWTLVHVGPALSSLLPPRGEVGR
jgi:hypothetical protein